MCDTCGCNITHGNESLIRPGGKLEKTESGREAVSVLHNLLHENDHTAKHNRDHFDQHNVLAINLMSSPGAGKTALLEATIQQLGAFQEPGNTGGQDGTTLFQCAANGQTSGRS
jgi:hydrogenase nickel incorporation protein HypB